MAAAERLGYVPDLLAASLASDHSNLVALLVDDFSNPHKLVMMERLTRILRQNGWRGSGYVRWEHPGNRGFLRSLAGLQRTAAEIGEDDEAERCAQFLRQLDPGWPPPDLEG